MARKFAWITVLLMVCACIRFAFAMGEVVIVTKETQAKLGLNFSLEAERVSKEVVLVRVEVPREGKLKALRSVGMSIGKTKAFENGSPMLSAQLQTTPGKNGSWVATFQLAPELADKCSVDLNVPESDRTYTIYAVELKGYVTDRK